MNQILVVFVLSAVSCVLAKEPCEGYSIDFANSYATATGPYCEIEIEDLELKPNCHMRAKGKTQFKKSAKTLVAKTKSLNAAGIPILGVADQNCCEAISDAAKTEDQLAQHFLGMFKIPDSCPTSELDIQFDEEDTDLSPYKEHLLKGKGVSQGEFTLVADEGTEDQSECEAKFKLVFKGPSLLG